MTRQNVAARVLTFVLMQVGNLLHIAAALVRPSFAEALEKSFGRYLVSATDPFDQSSSNTAIGRRLNPSQRNALIEGLCQRAAKIYGAPIARLSLGGSSKSIRQIIGHVIPRAIPGKSVILLDPACHKSVFGGLIESGLEVVFLRRTSSSPYGIFGPIDERHFRTCLARHTARTAAVVLTHPTYEGFVSDLSKISGACRDAGVLLCIDSAWGSNFGIVDGLPSLPFLNADIVITSPHKKGAAPSQVGLIFFQSELHACLYDEASQVGCETTSPNWHLLLLFEYRLAEIENGQWSNVWQGALEEANSFRALIAGSESNLSTPRPSDLGYTGYDPTHVYICTKQANANGIQLANTLSLDFKIDVEMAGPNGLLFLFGPAHSGKSPVLAEALTDALRQIARSGSEKTCTAPLRAIEKHSRAFHPRSAYFANSEDVALIESIGRTASTLIYAYPPGIPLLAYGETIADSHVEIINRLSRDGAVLTGLSKDRRIRVTRAPPAGGRQITHTNRQLNLTGTNMETKVTSESLTITGYPFGETPINVINDVARLFREIFCNPPYNQFAAHTDDPGTPLSFADLAPFGYQPVDAYQSLDLLDAATLPSQHFRWMEPGEFEDRFRAKAHQLYVVTGHGKETNALKAFIVCRVLTVRELFYSEEFRNPVYFSGREFLRTLRSADEFYELMRFHFNLKPEDQIWWIVGMGAHPSARGENFVFPGMNIISDHINEEHLQIPSLGEVAAYGAGRVHGEAVHEKVIHGILQNDHALIYARTVQRVVDQYRRGPGHVDAQIKKHIEIAKSGIAPHPSDHPGIEIRSTKNKGTGVFATRSINPGEMIAEFVGSTYSAKYESELPGIMIDRCIQIGPTTYVFAENRLAEKINHSCQPNCGVREKTKIVAIYPIAAGDEICWDYRMSENSDWVLENCQCGAERCAKRIETYESLPEDIRQEYLQRGAISSWLLDL